MIDLATMHKHQLLNQLLGLVREQTRALQADDLERFLLLMDERESVIAELTAVAADDAPDNVVPFPALTPANVSSSVDMTIRRLLRAIIDEDDENIRLLQSQMNELSGAITRTVRNRAAGGGYAAILSGQRARPAVDRVC